MQKDFDNWNLVKKKTEQIQNRALFKEREVWWCRLGTNIGDEQNGKGKTFTRPILVFKKFNRNVFIGIPLSTQIKDNKFYFRIKLKGVEQSVVLSQIKLIDAKRFGDKMGEIPSNEFNLIKQKLKDLIF